MATVEDKPALWGFQSHNGAIAAVVVGASNREPTRVSIPQWCDCCLTGIALTNRPFFSFNPTMVRLLPAHPLRARKAKAVFQSHNGAIAAEGAERELLGEEGFNPTMVRLLLCPDTCGLGRPKVSIPQWCDCCPTRFGISGDRRLWFQSHNGAIAASDGMDGRDRSLWFQSHNGAIAATRSPRSSPPQMRFNPTMVRLLLISSAQMRANAPSFQSHNGAIAAGTIASVLDR